MAISNYERFRLALELLRKGLGPYMEREFRAKFKGQADDELNRRLGLDRINANKPVQDWDASAQLKVMIGAWPDVFDAALGRTGRTLVNEILDWRNKHAHQTTMSGDDTERALDSVARLLTAISAAEAAEVEKMRLELRRLVFDEQIRSEKRRTAGTAVEGATNANLKPWREVVTPHKDVASGRYQQAEFAADLWQVYLGEGTDEYRNPGEFFRRTYLTESLKTDAGGRRAPAERPGRRPGGTTANQLRRRQDALDAGALSPFLWGEAEPTCRDRCGDARGRSESCRQSGAWCWWATRFPRATQ